MKIEKLVKFQITWTIFKKLQILILKIMVKKENSEGNGCINNILKFDFKKINNYF